MGCRLALGDLPPPDLLRSPTAYSRPRTDCRSSSLVSVAAASRPPPPPPWPPRPSLPITWHNYKASGRFQLLTSNSDITLYLGNNRDSTGLGEYSPAYLATHTLVNQGKTTYFRQTLDDIRHDPLRWVQLMTRKTALYLGDPELPNNVDFYAEGTAISPLLAALPLRFGAMMALALAGVVLAWPHRNGTLLLLIYILSQVAVTIVYHVFSRFRAPIYPVLVILSAYSITLTL